MAKLERRIYGTSGGWSGQSFVRQWLIPLFERSIKTPDGSFRARAHCIRATRVDTGWLGWVIGGRVGGPPLHWASNLWRPATLEEIRTLECQTDDKATRPSGQIADESTRAAAE